MEKSTVLQSELESCKELQELEPENKCENLPTKKAWPGDLLEQRVLRSYKHLSVLSPGCLLTIILLMRALDPLLYEKETLQYFNTLKASWAWGDTPREAQWATGRQLTHVPACFFLNRLWTQ